MRILIIILSMLFSNTSCTQIGPGYKFELFSETSAWELAKAVRDENVDKIVQYVTSGNIDVNSREPKLGQSLLMLAAANNKSKSAKALLQNKAKVDLTNFQNETALHEVTEFNSNSKEGYKMIKLLIEYGADVNKKTDGGQEGYVYVPLMGGVKDLDVTKLLLQNGGDLYFKSSSPNPDYLVWNKMLLDLFGDGILVAKYLIIEKKVGIPEIISYDLDNQTQDIYFYLDQVKFNGNSEKEQAQKDILEYLKAINFPKSKTQAYKQ